MATLKELTWENHKRAERHLFVVNMVRNQLTKQQWAEYLIWKRNLLVEIDARLGLYHMHQDFDRTAKFDEDVIRTGANANGLKASLAYSEHIKNTSDEDLWAHVYVHYLGDLKGGQMLKKMVQLPMQHVDYEDADQLEMIIRAHVHDELADEANRAFELTMAVMEEIMA
jgi:heme oxygenase